MARKVDSRIIKTRTALFKALIDILGEKNYDDITVNELCERADVRRATFYKHFVDKNDFLHFIVRRLRENFDNTVWNKATPETSADYYISYTESLVKFLYKHRPIVNTMLSGDATGSIIGMLIKQNYDDTVIKLNTSVKEGMVLSASSSTTAAVLTGGVAVAIIRWFINDDGRSMEQLIDELSTIIRNILKNDE